MKKNVAGFRQLSGIYFFKITRTKTAADRWEGLTVLIFAAIGIYMIIKEIKKKNVLERRKDEIEWKKTGVHTGLEELSFYLPVLMWFSIIICEKWSNLTVDFVG